MKLRRKGPVTKSPISTNSSQWIPLNKKPWVAADVTSFIFCAKSPGNTGAKPDSKPQDTAIINSAGEKQSILLSERLRLLLPHTYCPQYYIEPISMEIIGGTDMEIKRGITFFVPMMFFRFFIFIPLFPKNYTLKRIDILNRFVNVFLRKLPDIHILKMWCVVT